MKKIILIVGLMMMIFQSINVLAQTCNPVGQIDITGDGIKEKVYSELVSRGSSQIRKIIINKNGRNIFPEEYPRLEPFIAKNGMTFKTVYGSFGGYAIDKFDNLPGKQVLIFGPSKEFIVKGKQTGCWQEDFQNIMDGKIVKKIFVEAHLFRFNPKTGKFEYYRDDCIYYLSNNKPSKEEIIKMFKNK